MVDRQRREGRERCEVRKEERPSEVGVGDGAWGEERRADERAGEMGRER